LLDRQALEASLDFKFGQRNLLITFHPVTLEGNSSTQQMEELLAALDELTNTNLIFTLPNADTGGREIARMIQEFVSTHSHSRVYASLGQLRYLSCMKYVDGVVGNSSSGLAEAPSMRVGTIDIGDRQKGRLSASSIIHCEPNLKSIREALKRLYEPTFQYLVTKTVNPYGSGGASKKIVEVLKKHPLDCLLKKKFYDLPMAPLMSSVK
jgi:GDP/UDP-N,N'-diacetylbacillosamine 2-epimerase (hydrolysing)